MKILVLGDVHGRSCWRDILAKENPDLTIFLGDFVTTHEGYTAEQQLTQLKAILELKEENPQKFIILRGNHDLDGLGYYWARCSPSAAGVQAEMSKDMDLGQWFLEESQWIHVREIGGKKYIFAHAGVSVNWLTNILKLNIDTPENLASALGSINNMEPSEKFGFTGDHWDCYGTHPDQSCTWIRPDTLCEYGPADYSQVVGHTGTYSDCQRRQFLDISYKEEDGERYAVYKESDRDLWMCDALQQKAYLIIENDKFIPKRL
jgi:predicted phosphodiesterase